MSGQPHILVINPGSTSTKVAWYEGERMLEKQSWNHSGERWIYFSDREQIKRRGELIDRFLNGRRPELIMARGGLLKPLPSGVYEINEAMLNDLLHSPYRHASNLAAPIAYALAQKLGIKSYIADPVTTDELQDLARIAGHPDFQRKSIFHALNHKATARRFAAQKGQSYESLNLIVVHMGGGISVGAHRQGRVVDVNQALDGEGPMTPQRSGTLPAGDLVRAAFSGNYTLGQLLSMITGQGGLKAYTGTDDLRQLLENPSRENLQYIDAMIYQTAKAIGEMHMVLKTRTDAILLTGGLAHSEYVVDELKKYISDLAPVYVFPGENELDALAYNGYLVWTGQIIPVPYS